MRSRPELLLAATLVALCYGVTWHAAQARQCDGFEDKKCGGHSNCVIDTCISQPTGESCAMVTPIDHPKCGPGSQSDCCDPSTEPCATITYYGGGPCTGDPPQCLDLEDPVGVDVTTEAGCSNP